MGGRGDRAGVAAWALEAWCVLGRGDPGGRERSPGGAEAPRGRASQRGSGRGGPGPRCEASAGPPRRCRARPEPESSAAPSDGFLERRAEKARARGRHLEPWVLDVAGMV